MKRSRLGKIMEEAYYLKDLRTTGEASNLSTLFFFAFI
jgi:hypothetical protein